MGVWIGENESAKFWLSVMNGLKNRGVKDVYVFCVDGLAGFREAINAAFPKSQIQRCIIHQIRSSTRYVSYKDIKSLMSDLKKVYQAINEDEALNALLDFKEKWQKSYPKGIFYSTEKGNFVPKSSTDFAKAVQQNELENAKRDICATAVRNFIKGHRTSTTLRQLYEKYCKKFPQFTKDYLRTASEKSIMLYLEYENKESV